jgi:DNA invertase Pin-like site-specific DNA recombinase
LIASPGASATCRISFAPCRRAALSLNATEQPIDTATAAGKCFLDMLGVFAEFETNLRRERQPEGIAKAKAAGVYKGRPASIEAARVRELKAQGMMVPIIAPTLERFSITTYVELPKDKYNEWKTLDMVIPAS